MNSYMKNKGFTLIELLAVIVILAIIALIAVPIILNIIKDSKEEADQRSIEMYVRAVELAISNYQLEEGKIPTSIKQLEELGYLQYNGPEIQCNINSIKKDGSIFLSKCKIDGREILDYEYGSFELAVIVPNGMTPVIYKEGNWEIVSLSSKWFDYDNQEWANAVILNDGVSSIVGTKLNVETDIKAMFVYVPRYEYKIEGEYGKHSDGTQGTRELPGEIKINFIPKNQKKASEENYIVHPAFTFGEEELEGIWVGKFEISSKTSLKCTDENCEIADNLRILPNVISSRSSVSNFFYGIRSMSRKENGFGIVDDTHMIKNSEWGAIAYLSQSKYGKYGNNNYTGTNKEIYQNKSTVTGNSNGTPSVDTFRDTEGGQTGIDGTSQCAYDITINNCGIGASTTGNITGIYDMSSGTGEMVMGVILDANSSPVLGSSGFEEFGNIDPKYYDTYTSYGKSDIGHALSETSSSGLLHGKTAWYNDDTSFIFSGQPWFNRGQSGIFSFNYSSGSSLNYRSTRVVLISQ